MKSGCRQGHVPSEDSKEESLPLPKFLVVLVSLGVPPFITASFVFLLPSANCHLLSLCVCVPDFPLTRTPIILGVRAHTRAHLNLIKSAKTLFPIKVTLIGTGWHKTRGDIIPPTRTTKQWDFPKDTLICIWSSCITIIIEVFDYLLCKRHCVEWFTVVLKHKQMEGQRG